MPLPQVLSTLLIEILEDDRLFPTVRFPLGTKQASSAEWRRRARARLPTVSGMTPMVITSCPSRSSRLLRGTEGDVLCTAPPQEGPTA